MDISPDKQNIDRVFSNTAYFIDFYQRDYRWTDEPVLRRVGVIKDDIGINKQMNLALEHYSKADSSNIEKIEASIVVVRDHLDLLGRIFHQFDTKPYFCGSPTGQFDCPNKATEPVQGTIWPARNHRRRISTANLRQFALILLERSLL